MQSLRFEWDQRKNTQNKRKHGVSFEEAETVFLDDRALLVDDPDHSGHEERLVLLGIERRVANAGRVPLLPRIRSGDPSALGPEGDGH